jgi:hypothetical protein
LRKKINELKAERLDWFEDQLFRFLRPRRMVERDALAQFGIGARQARNYMKAARDRWRENRSANAEEIRQELDGGLRELIARCYEAGDNRTVAVAMRELSNLHGAAEAQKVEISGSLGVVETDPDKARERLAALRTKQKV